MTSNNTYKKRYPDLRHSIILFCCGFVTSILSNSRGLNKFILFSDRGVSWPDIQHSQMNTSGDVDISPPDVVGGAGHSMPSEGSTSSPDVQVIQQ